MNLKHSIIGVIDVRDGLAVHAVAGHRDRYRVIDQPWCRSGSVIELAEAYENVADGIYIADLDAILERSDRSADAITNLIRSPNTSAIWLDGGLGRKSWSPAYDLASANVCWVVGTETLEDWGTLAKLGSKAKRAGGKVALSLDFRSGQLVSANDWLEEWTLFEIVERSIELGIAEFIVLDLAAVGVSKGPKSFNYISRIRTHFEGAQPPLRLISGGGIRNSHDLEALLNAGCDRVLVATWLHQQFS